MKGKSWFRMYVDFLEDPKVISLAFEDQRHFVAVCALKCSGVLDQDCKPEIMDRLVAQRLWVDPSAIREVKRRLVDAGLIDEGWCPLAWDRRQFVSDHDPTGAERQKRYRERHKLQQDQQTNNVNAQRNAQRNAPITPLETDTDTDKEKDSSQTSGEVRTASAPNCPYEKLTELYREHFPDQRQPRTDISDRRKAIMRKGWMHASRLRKRDGSGLLYNGDPTGLTFWDGFMGWIAKHCEFCMTEQTNFDIEWLFTPRAIDNLIDGKYTAVRERKRA